MKMLSIVWKTFDALRHFCKWQATPSQATFFENFKNSILKLHEMTPRGLEITKIFLGEAPRPPPLRIQASMSNQNTHLMGFADFS